jgi:hypothetical protein
MAAVSTKIGGAERNSSKKVYNATVERETAKAMRVRRLSQGGL